MTILPSIHMNGTSAAALREGYVEAMRAVANAIEVASKIEFNARDYYVQGEGVYLQAKEQFTRHLRALREAREYFEEVAIYCDQWKEGVS